ncbi:hypothetical protein FZC78_06505 [Rossellomorea vietnamensis]|uniref:Uncharacterized protein n=1 Tax=Rossellomorea vietnamensis TaxID=218284 RepID=A0A5D4NTA6_9BACI|nr:hypothetical protein [Rossellomorea vietnamensis]TYS17525.1 hypothetical protein FZC78_06505 [Rossellomorea vietnamensis]
MDDEVILEETNRDSRIQMNNFEFLRNYWNVLYKMAKAAEENVETVCNISLIKIRMFGGQLTKKIIS